MNHIHNIIGKATTWWRVVLVMVVAVCSWQSVSAQEKNSTRKGVVIDRFNNPIDGVVVTLKGTSLSVETGTDGTFNFGYTKDDVLVFSHPLYNVKELKVSGKESKKKVVVHLSEKKASDEKPVVDAYGNAKSRDEYLGSSSTVYTKDLEKYLAPNILTALQGRMAGLNVSQYRGFALRNTSTTTSGSLLGTVPSSFGNSAYSDNSQFSFSSRGQGPVVIVDGVERELFSIDPEAIESVTIQKDALSSMFLGMRSSRGALIITTKNPSEGGLHLSLTGKLGVHSSVTKLHPLSSATYSYLLNEALQNDGKSSLYTYDDYQAYLNQTSPYTHPDVNWADELLEDNAISQSYNLNVSGGGKVAQYFVSLGYLNEQGLFKTDDSQGYNTNLGLNRYMISSKVNINITDDFTATMTAFGRIEEGNQPGGSGSGYSDLLLNIYNIPNNAYPIKNPDGSWGGSLSRTNNLMSQTVNSGYIADNARDVIASLKLNYDFNKIVEGLSAYVLGSVASQNRTAITRTKQSPVYAYKLNESGQPQYTMYGSSVTQSNSFTDVSSYRSLYGQLAVNYERRFGDHGLRASLKGDTRNDVINYDLPLIPSNVMQSLDYDYAKRYFAQVAVTESYYNRYAPGNRWGTFFAFGLGWNIAEEKFMEDVSWVDNLKLRAVYGNTGSGISNSGYYIWRQTYSDDAGYYVQGTSMSAPSYRYVYENGLANPYITWEKAHKINVGFDASLFTNRLLMSFDYYNDKYYDLLQSRGKSIEMLGTSYPTENIGKVRRYGAELAITYQDHINDFNYYATANWSVEQNKLLFMDEQDVEYDYQRQTGRPLGTVYGLIADGFLTAEDLANDCPVISGYNNIQPGDVKYVDLNDDGVIDEFDRTVIGGDKALQYFGIDLGFEWKGLEFSMFWQGCYNRDMYLSDRTLIEGFQASGSSYGQAYENIIDRWTPETATTAKYPRLSAGGNNYNYGNGWNSSMWMVSGNYIRLKNISLAYRLPETFCNNFLGGVNVKVFVNAQNLVTFSACDLVDPEVSFTSSPLQKCIFTGVTLDF